MSGFPMQDENNFTSRNSRGAASELIACAYLLATGYHVFRSVSPASPYDLVVCSEAAGMQRVEIKSVSKSERGHLFFARPRNEEWELLVVVGPDGRCFVFGKSSSYEEQTNAIRLAYGLEPVRAMSRRIRTGIEVAA